MLDIQKYIPLSEYALENKSREQPLSKSKRQSIKKKRRLWTRYQTRNDKEVEKRYKMFVTRCAKKRELGQPVSNKI